MVTDLILPVMLIAFFPFVFPIEITMISIFALAIYATENTKPNNKPTFRVIKRRVFTVKCTVHASYDYERSCTNSVSQLFKMHDLPPITTRSSVEILNLALNYGFVVRVHDNYHTLRRHSFSRAVCFSDDFSHVWTEVLTIHNYSTDSARIFIRDNLCYGRKTWKQLFSTYGLIPHQYSEPLDTDLFRYSEKPLKRDFNYGWAFGNYGCTIPTDMWNPTRIESNHNCLSFLAPYLVFKNSFDTTHYNNMYLLWKNWIVPRNFGICYHDREDVHIISVAERPEYLLVFECIGHVYLTTTIPQLFKTEQAVRIPWMTLNGRPNQNSRKRRQITGKLFPGGVANRQPQYGALEDIAIANQQIEDQIDQINLQSEMLEAQNHLNELQNPPPPQGPILRYNYQCPTINFKNIPASGILLLTVSFLFCTIIHYAIPFVLSSSNYETLIFRLFSMLFLATVTILFSATHYYNHYTIIHIPTGHLNMSNREYAKMFIFDLLFGFAGVVYVILENYLSVTRLRSRFIVGFLSCILLSINYYIDFEFTSIFFRLFAFLCYFLVYLLEENCDLSTVIYGNGIHPDVDIQDDLRPDAFQVNKFKYQRSIQQVVITTYSQKYYLYKVQGTQEMVDLEVFAQLLNANFDRYDNPLSDVKERMVRFIATCSTINRRKDLFSLYPRIDQSTVALALQYINYKRHESSLAMIARGSLNF